MVLRICILLFMAATARAALPSFNSFNAGNFTNDGTTISLKQPVVGTFTGNGSGLTNIVGVQSFVAAGTNVTVVTNGSVYTVSGSAVGGGISAAAGSGITAATNGSVVTFSTNGQTLSWSGQTQWPGTAVTNGYLTNWNLVPTNSLSSLTNPLGTAAYSNSINFQPASSTLSNTVANVFTTNLPGAHGILAADVGAAAYIGTNGFAGATTGIGSIISNRNSAIINVKDFGALGTGGAPPNDDSLAISNAWAAWTNRGGVLYFPAGTYVDTNSHILNMSGQAAIDGVGIWAPFSIVGDGAGVSRWQAKITNAAFIWSTNLPVNWANLRLEDVGSGTNHGFRIAGAPQGNIVLSQCVFRNFKGYGFDAGATDLGQCVQARFDGCGVGLRIGGFADAWSGSVTLTKSIFAGMILGYTNFNSLGVRNAQAMNFYINGNLNQNAVIVGPGYGTTISGALESCTNAAIAVGFPAATPAFVENAPQDAIGAIGSVAVRNFNLLDNGAVGGNILVKVYTAPRQVILDSVNAGTITGAAIVSTLAAGDTIPMTLRGAVANTNIVFSDGTAIMGNFGTPAGVMNVNANVPELSFNKAINTFSVDPIAGITNGTFIYPAIAGSRDFTNWVAWIANTFTLDSDASNYCSRAGISDFATKFAINQFMLDIKAPLADGFIQITNINAWYPMLGSSSNSTAQNLLGSTNNITWAASGGTYASDGVTGNGTTFYGDTALNLKTGAGLVYNTNSAFIYVYSRTQSPTDQGRLASGEQFNSFTVRNGIYPSGSSIVADGPNNGNVSIDAFAVSSDFRGSFAVTRTSSTASALFAGTNQANYVDTSLATPNATFGFLARDTDQGQDHFSNAKIQGGGVGGALTYAHYIDLKTKWERCLALIALGQSIGATGPGSFLNPSNYFAGHVTVLGQINGNGTGITNNPVMSWSGNSGNTAVAAATTYFFAPGAQTATLPTADASAGTRSVVTRLTNLRNFYVVQSAAPGAAKNYTYTVMTNGVASDIVATVNGASATSANDSAHVRAVVAGTEIGIKLVTDAAVTVAKVSWSLEGN
jgi:hypothetical protein